GYHFAHQRFLFGSVIQKTHLFEQAIILGVFIIGCIFAAIVGLGVRAIQQKKKILGIGVVGHPTPHIHLRAAIAHFVLETVVVGGTDFELDIDGRQLPTHPVEHGARTHASGGIIMQDERLSGACIAAVGIARFGQQALGV